MTGRLLYGRLLWFVDPHRHAALAQGNRARLLGRIVGQGYCNARFTGLRIPAPEYIQVFAGILLRIYRLHGADEVVAGNRLTVVAAEVFVQAGTESDRKSTRLNSSH